MHRQALTLQMLWKSQNLFITSYRFVSSVIHCLCLDWIVTFLIILVKTFGIKFYRNLWLTGCVIG